MLVWSRDAPHKACEGLAGCCVERYCSTRCVMGSRCGSVESRLSTLGADEDSGGSVERYCSTRAANAGLGSVCGALLLHTTFFKRPCGALPLHTWVMRPVGFWCGAVVLHIESSCVCVERYYSTRAAKPVWAQRVEHCRSAWWWGNTVARADAHRGFGVRENGMSAPRFASSRPTWNANAARVSSSASVAAVASRMIHDRLRNRLRFS